MSSFHTKPIYPKQQNIGTVLWATVLWDNLFKRFGLLDQIISDQDPIFSARAFQELLKLLNITSSLSTAYHPQTDRATEQVNQEIEAYLLIYCTTHPEDWLNSLTTMEFTHNNRKHAEWKHTPFKLILGDNPISIPVTFQYTKYPNIEEKMNETHDTRKRRSISCIWISQNKNGKLETINLCSIWKRTKSMVGYLKFQN